MATPYRRSEWVPEPPEDYSLADLPNDILVHVLEHLPLVDLANARLVCSRLQQILDENAFAYIWANASLCGVWVAPETQAIIQRAADCGNVEALIKMAVAYLYGEGVPDGPGKGTIDALNGLKATEYLTRAEKLIQGSQQPFSWVLFRAPWAPSNPVCCKACVCHRIKIICRNSNKEEVTGLHYCIGKALSFHEDVEQRREVVEWYESAWHCPYSTLEIWRLKHLPELSTGLNAEIQSIRLLREAASVNCSGSFPEAQFELCEAYAGGYYGGISREVALGSIRQLMASARPVHWKQIFTRQKDMTPNMRHILIDWLCEVAEVKELPTPTLHLAITLVDRYMLCQRVKKTQFQLLGITALLVASRWMGMTIITIREAAWLTDSTYKYEDVVRMMGELVATLRGDIRRSTVVDYMHILLKLMKVKSESEMAYMAYYLSESLLLYMDFARYTAAHLAAACVLTARILLNKEYPWPSFMVDSTGFTVRDLQKCCLMIYQKCLSGRYSVKDHREKELHAIKDRFADERFYRISEEKLMSFKELKEHLGVEPDCFLLTPDVPKKQQERQKLLSFLSDSCYLTSPDPNDRCYLSSPDPNDRCYLSSPVSNDSCYLSSPTPNDRCYLSSPSPNNRSDLSESESECGDLEESLLEQFSTQRLSSGRSSSSSSLSLNNHGQDHGDLPLGVSSHRPCIEVLHIPCPSGLRSPVFPQPLFSDCDSLPSSPTHDSSYPLDEQMDISEHPGSPLTLDDSPPGFFDPNFFPLPDFQFSHQSNPPPQAKNSKEQLPKENVLPHAVKKDKLGIRLQRAPLRPVDNHQHNFQPTGELKAAPVKSMWSERRNASKTSEQPRRKRRANVN